jgi:hypothetical protein
MAKEIKPKSFKLDIFKVIEKLNKGDLHIWETLSEEEQKGFGAYIITRWMSGTTDMMQIMLINELVNPIIFNLGKHPELLCKMLACCGTKSYRKFNWVADSKTNKVSSGAISVLKETYNYSTREAQQMVHLLSKDDIIELAENLGMQKEEITKLKKEL